MGIEFDMSVPMLEKNSLNAYAYAVWPVSPGWRIEGSGDSLGTLAS
jgi:hypothetical protein